jgi:hypothetical protein
LTNERLWEMGLIGRVLNNQFLFKMKNREQKNILKNKLLFISSEEKIFSLT